MKSLIFTFIVTFGLTSCTKDQVGCKVESALLTGGSLGIATAMKCTNQEAIKADLAKITKNLNLCQKTTAKFIGCPILAGMLAGQVGNLIPATWGCDAAATKDQMAAALTSVCEKVL